MTAPARVVVLGSGFAGLETAFLLRSLADPGAAEITMVSDSDEFLFKPNSIYLPFGGAEAPLRIPLGRPLARRRITRRVATVEDVDLDRGVVHTSRGMPLHYDHLVIATGAGMRPEEVPGLAEHARTIWSPDQLHQLGADLAALARRAAHGHRQRLVFLVPPGNKCAGPLYEIALMADTWLGRRELRHRVDIAFATYEHSFVHAFGPRLHGVIAGQFSSRGIDAHTGAVVAKVDAEHVVLDDGRQLPYDVLVTFPPYVAGAHYDGLPADDRGFLRCEPATRAVVGHPEVFAPGDAGDFPVKQAFLALLQADAVARAVAARLRGTEPGTGFDPLSMCVMEMLDKATFAQVPLRLTGDPADPVAVDDDHLDQYRVGTSQVWRLGKQALAHYLPLRFRRGLPFHSGAPWRAMDLALRAGARLLAT